MVFLESLPRYPGRIAAGPKVLGRFCRPFMYRGPPGFGCNQNQSSRAGAAINRIRAIPIAIGPFQDESRGFEERTDLDQVEGFHRDALLDRGFAHAERDPSRSRIEMRRLF